MIQPLYLTNTLTGRKELFTPLKAPQVTMYVCGITPYDYAHLGHGRCYVTFDVLYRLLRWLGYTVTYCRNFTDIDDKLLKRAQELLGDQERYHEIAQTYIASYGRDMAALNCLPPTVEPRVTDTIADIILFIEQLIAKGVAYEAEGDVYFSIEKAPEYGKLSKRKLEDLKVGARVLPNEKKRNPLDFALWKSEPECSADARSCWQSPWGYGRPGWHIECSVMSYKYLSAPIDIHGGGMDLIFPHHENEIAQSEGLLGDQVVRYWLHNAFVNINKEKMSKSLGNFLTLHELCAEYDPMVVRFYFAQHYYRAPLEFAVSELDGVLKSYKRLCAVFAESDTSTLTPERAGQSRLVQRMQAFLTDDMNTSGMFGVLFDALDVLRTDTAEAASVAYFLQQVLGLTLTMPREKSVTITPEIQLLIDERQQARARKDWKRADELRDALRALGVEVQDSKAH